MTERDMSPLTTEEEIYDLNSTINQQAEQIAAYKKLIAGLDAQYREAREDMRKLRESVMDAVGMSYD